MAPRPESTLSLDAVQDYFAHLNPIAQRISCDIDHTKSAYGQLWDTLNANEQNDIINETLMKPEISLRYFDNFSTPLSSTEASSPCSSNSETMLNISKISVPKSLAADSLLVISPKNGNTNVPPKRPIRDKQEVEKRSLRSKPFGSNSKCYYAYDGRNLKTYALQKVALKIVHDDVLGTYRDEHSTPFSYRTMSQINLHLMQQDASQAPNTAAVLQQSDDHVYLLNCSSDTNGKRFTQKGNIRKDKTIFSYKKLQNELKISLSHHLDKAKIAGDNETSNYERFGNKLISSPMPISKSEAATTTKPQAATCSANKAKKVDTKKSINSIENKLILHADLIDSCPTLKPSINYAVYTDAYFDHEETSNLMQNCTSTGVLTASSSSAATSDDDRYDYEDDEKTLCEDVKLLDNDINLRRGFDFLNNW